MHEKSPQSSKITQCKFNGMRMHPIGLFVSLTLEPKGHRQSRPILNVCIAKGILYLVLIENVLVSLAHVYFVCKRGVRKKFKSFIVRFYST